LPRATALETAAIESIAATPQTALDWVQRNRRAMIAAPLAFRIVVRVRDKKASMPAVRAEHGDAS
jgi:hypothetical protein